MSMTVSAFGQSAQTQKWCLSDDDLRVVLIANSIEGLSVISGTCIANYPPLASNAAKSLSEFQRQYSIGIGYANKLSTEALQRAGLGDAEIAQIKKLSNSSSMKVAAVYTEDQCKRCIGMEQEILRQFRRRKKPVCKCAHLW